MDRDPRPTPPPDEDAPPPELLAVVEQASRHLGVGGREEAPRPVLRFDATRPGGRRLWVLGVLLALSVAAAALPWLFGPRSQAPGDVEADLRWAVAHVAREVEAYQARTGSLPEADFLRPLLGEHLAYEASDDAYVITAERDGIEVRFDGTVPLETWLTEPAR